jgi:hypothetical protein
LAGLLLNSTVPIIKQMPKKTYQSRLSVNRKRIDSESFSVLINHNSVLNEFEKLTNDCFKNKKLELDNSQAGEILSEKTLSRPKKSNIIAKAIATVDFTPSPYDESSLTLKVIVLGFGD